MYDLTIEREFSAAHRLRGYQGQCAHLHGHNYRVQVTVRGDKLDEVGMTLDFSDLGDICEAVLSDLDHANLNEVPPFDEMNPTSENLARYVYEQIAARLPAQVRMRAVTVYESPRSWVTWSED